MRAAPQHIVVMGVSGSGKSTIAALLAARLGYLLADGDDFHPAANVAKMARGEPLADADREPWLRTLADWLQRNDEAGRSTVLACSALKRRYRDTLRSGAPQRVRFVHLDVPPTALRERMRHRTGHFMPAGLLDSQLTTLEPLAPDEPGVTVDGAGAPEAVAAAALAQLAAR